MTRSLLVGLFLILPLLGLQARNFKSYTIPGAACGNGMAYKVWIDQENKNNRKLAAEFVGP